MKSSIIWKWILGIVSLAMFVFIALNIENAAPVDNAVYGALSAVISPAMTAFFTGCTNLVSPLSLAMITAVLFFAMKHKEYRIPLLANLCIAILLNLGLKNLFTRQRPADVIHLATEGGYSFPSGHTMAAACFFGFLIWLFWRHGKKRSWRIVLTALLSMVIVLVAASRIYLGVHFFTDVFAGLCISACYLIVFTTFVDLFFSSGEEEKLHRFQENSRFPLLRSFSYAIEGIVAGLKTERNMIIHFGFSVIVVVFGALLGLSATEWLICAIFIGGVFMAELFNTAIETVVDMVCQEKDPRAKLAKDAAAGAVLCLAIAAAAAGVIIFLPKLIDLVKNGL